MLENLNLSEHYAHVTSSEFYTGTWKEPSALGGADMWMRGNQTGWTEPTLAAQTDGSMKISDAGANSFIVPLYRCRKIKTLTAGYMGEMQKRISFRAKMKGGSVGVSFGFYSTSKPYSLAFLGFSSYGGKVTFMYCSTEHDDPAVRLPVWEASGQRALIDDYYTIEDSGVISNYDPQNVANSYEFLVAYSYGSQLSVRLGFLLNGHLAWTRDGAFKASYLTSDLGLIPWIGVAGEYQGWMKLYSLVVSGG